MEKLEMTMINFFVCPGGLPPPPPPHQRHLAICEAALPPSSCHLWAAGRSGSVSQLSVPPPQSGARLFDACSCLSHPGENHLDRNKMKSLYLTLWRPFNRVVMHCYSLFHVFSLQDDNWCGEQMLLTRLIISYYMRPGPHLLPVSFCESWTCRREALKTVVKVWAQQQVTKRSFNRLCSPESKWKCWCQSLWHIKNNKHYTWLTGFYLILPSAN